MTSKTDLYCGFDIGGTKVLGIVIQRDDPLTPLAMRTEATIADSDRLVATITKMVQELEADCSATVTAVGVGIAGIVDYEGVLKASPNIAGVVDLHLRQRLLADLCRPVVVENDATAAVWAESQHGSAKGCRHVALVALGTGLGTGFVLDGHLHRGWNGFAGESGHMVIDLSGPEHLTGARGPWEYYASGTGLARMARQSAAAGSFDSAIAEAGSLEAIRGEHVHSLIARNHPDALVVLDEFCSIAAVGLANLVHILDPEIVVVGGGLIDIGEPLVQGLQTWTRQRVLGGTHRRPVSVVPARFGRDAGAVGAALLAAESA